MPAIFEYPVTRPVTLRYFTPTLLVLGVVWITFITFVNVVVVGYDYVPLVSASFNISQELWYQEFVPKSWAPKTRICAGSTIKIDEGCLIFVLANDRPRYEWQELWLQDAGIP